MCVIEGVRRVQELMERESYVTDRAIATTVFLAMELRKPILIEGPGTVWMPREPFWTRCIRLASDLNVRGLRIFDLQIGLIAFDNGATEVWTHDRDFVGLPGLRVHDPL